MRQHPNLWLLVGKLKTEDKLARNCIVQVEMGDAPRAQRRKWKVLNAQISRVLSRYQRRTRTLEQLWDTVSLLCRNL